MREPDTPGGFNDSITCKPASSSATAEDMVEMMRKRDHPMKLSSIKYEAWVNTSAGRRSTFYALLLTSIHEYGATMKVKVCLSRLRCATVNALVWSWETLRHGSKVELIADVTASRYVRGRREYLLD